MRTKTHRGFRSEKLTQEKLERPLQIRDADVLIDIQAFDLMKLRAVGRIHFVAAKGRARRDDANRRRRRFHRANLHGGSVRPEQPAIGQIKCVLLVAGRMIRRGVQRVEAMPFVLDVGTVREREPHPTENADRAVEHLGERMNGADLVRRAGERNVDAGERAASFAARSFSPVCAMPGGDRAAHFVQQFSDDRPLLLAERLHPFAPRGDAAAASEITDTHCFERLLVRQLRFPPARQRGVLRVDELMGNVKR